MTFGSVTSLRRNSRSWFGRERPKLSIVSRSEGAIRRSVISTPPTDVCQGYVRLTKLVSAIGPLPFGYVGLPSILEDRQLCKLMYSFTTYETRGRAGRGRCLTSFSTSSHGSFVRYSLTSL